MKFKASGFLWAFEESADWDLLSPFCDDSNSISYWSWWLRSLLLLAQTVFPLYNQWRNEGGQRGHKCPDRMTAGGAKKFQKCHKHFLQ